MTRPRATGPTRLGLQTVTHAVAGLRADHQPPLRVALRLTDLAEEGHDLVRDDDVTLARLRGPRARRG